MKKGTSRISIIIIGAIIIALIATVIVNDAIVAPKKIFFKRITSFAQDINKRYEDYKTKLGEDTIVSNKFKLTTFAQIDESLLTKEQIEMQKFLNKTSIEGRLEQNKLNFNASLKVGAKEGYNEKIKAHILTKDFKTYISLYDITQNNYIANEKNNLTKIAMAINNSKEKKEDTRKVLGYIEKSIKTKSVLMSNERLTIDKVAIDVEKYTLSMKAEDIIESTKKVIKYMNRNKKLMLNLNDSIALNVEKNKTAEEVLKDLESEIVREANKYIKMEFVIQVDKKTNKIVAISMQGVAKEKLADNLKLDIYNYKTPKQDVLINLYKNNKKVITLAYLMHDELVSNLNVEYNNLILNSVINKKEGLNITYSIKEKIDSEKVTTVEENNVQISGVYDFKQNINGKDKLYNMKFVNTGTTNNKKVDFRIEAEGMVEPINRIGDLDNKSEIKEYKELKKEVLDKYINNLKERIK